MHVWLWEDLCENYDGFRRYKVTVDGEYMLLYIKMYKQLNIEGKEQHKTLY